MTQPDEDRGRDSEGAEASGKEDVHVPAPRGREARAKTVISLPLFAPQHRPGPHIPRDPAPRKASAPDERGALGTTAEARSGRRGSSAQRALHLHCLLPPAEAGVRNQSKDAEEARPEEGTCPLTAGTCHRSPGGEIVSRPITSHSSAIMGGKGGEERPS